MHPSDLLNLPPSQLLILSALVVMAQLVPLINRKKP